MKAEQPKIPKLTKKTLRELFDLSDWMLRTKPWKKFNSTDGFIIVDPDSGDSQIVTVAGKAGEYFGFHLYQPPEGVRFLRLLHFPGEEDPDYEFAGTFEQHLLSVEFTDSDSVDDHDLDLMDDYGPAEDWSGPLDAVIFRSVHPGCPQWFLNEKEARRLVDGLRLLQCFCQEKMKPFCWRTLAFAVDPSVWNHIPTFRLPKGAKRNDASAWQFSKEPYDLPPEPPLDISRDDLFVPRLAGLNVKPETHWEIGVVCAQEPVLKDGVPVFSMISVVAVNETGRAEGTEVMTAVDDRAVQLRASFSTTAADLGYLPEGLTVASSLAAEVFAELAETKGIDLILDPEDMPMFDEIMESLLSKNDDSEEEPEISMQEVKALETLFQKGLPDNASDADFENFMNVLAGMPGGEDIRSQMRTIAMIRKTEIEEKREKKKKSGKNDRTTFLPGFDFGDEK